MSHHRAAALTTLPATASPLRPVRRVTGGISPAGADGEGHQPASAHDPHRPDRRGSK
ncbi:MAG: hypothetical protein R3F65_30680 [bacterium]